MRSDLDLRQKYLDTLARLEAGEARWGKLEVTLRLLIGRLCLAARGRAPLLDSELQTVNGLVRSRAGNDEIAARLEPLSRAIAALDELVDPGTSNPGTCNGDSHCEREASIQTVIVSVLERLERLPQLRPVLTELRERAKDALSAADFVEGLERVARLVGEQRANLLREKLEIEELLRQMDKRLEEIANHLAGETADQKSAQTSCQQLDLLVMNEVHSLNADVQRAEDMGALRSRVRERLETIGNYVREFRVREGSRVSAQLDRTQRMRVRVGELELEIHGLQKSLQEQQSLRLIDALTGIPNRAAYDDRIVHEFMRWQRDISPVSVLTWDIDRFKEINDAYGHSAGDKVLRVVAQHLAHHVRGTDFVARYGGEEFVMILIGTDADQASLAADKIRTGIANMGFHFHSKPVAVTASCGITTFRGDDTPESIFDRADQALYRAKEAGRNCCRIL